MEAMLLQNHLLIQPFDDLLTGCHRPQVTNTPPKKPTSPPLRLPTRLGLDGPLFSGRV